jgi:molecular chaperone DnaJ
MLGAIRQSQVCSECKGVGEVPETACRTCGAAGRVKAQDSIEIKIPEGIDDGQTIRVSGMGNAGTRSGKAGDLYITVRVMPSREYRRSGSDLYKTISIPFTTAVLGGEIKVPTLFGELKVKIPPATKAGEILKVKNYGVPKQGEGKGHLYLTIDIDVPARLTIKQRRLLQELDQEFRD